MAAVDVKSDLSGSVLEVNCQPGDLLDAEATIAVLESMKMEIPVAAPRAGRVLEVFVTAGDVISEGDVIARLE